MSVFLCTLSNFFLKAVLPSLKDVFTTILWVTFWVVLIVLIGEVVVYFPLIGTYIIYIFQGLAILLFTFLIGTLVVVLCGDFMEWLWFEWRTLKRMWKDAKDICS